MEKIRKDKPICSVDGKLVDLYIDNGDGLGNLRVVNSHDNDGITYSNRWWVDKYGKSIDPSFPDIQNEKRKPSVGEIWMFSNDLPYLITSIKDGEVTSINGIGCVERTVSEPLYPLIKDPHY